MSEERSRRRRRRGCSDAEMQVDHVGCVNDGFDAAADVVAASARHLSQCADCPADQPDAPATGDNSHSTTATTTTADVVDDTAGHCCVVDIVTADVDDESRAPANHDSSTPVQHFHNTPPPATTTATTTTTAGPRCSGRDDVEQCFSDQSAVAVSCTGADGDDSSLPVAVNHSQTRATAATADVVDTAGHCCVMDIVTADVDDESRAPADHDSSTPVQHFHYTRPPAITTTPATTTTTSPVTTTTLAAGAADCCSCSLAAVPLPPYTSSPTEPVLACLSTPRRRPGRRDSAHKLCAAACWHRLSLRCLLVTAVLVGVALMAVGVALGALNMTVGHDYFTASILTIGQSCSCSLSVCWSVQHCWLGAHNYYSVAPPEAGKGEASPLWVYGKIGRQLIC